MAAKEDSASSVYSVEVGHKGRPMYVAPADKNDFKELKVAVDAIMLRVARLEDHVGNLYCTMQIVCVDTALYTHCLPF